MRSRSIGFIIFVLALVACSKDKFETKPSLKIKEVNTSDVQPGEKLIVTLEYTDKEGDLAGGRVGVAKQVSNCPTSDFVDTVKYSISGDVPPTKNQKGQIDISLPYIFINPFCSFDDSAHFKFWITDKGGHQSDTVTTGLIIVRKS